MMKLISLLCALLVSSAAAYPDTLLEEKWAVLDPSFSYSGGVFTIETNHGEGVNWVSVGMYDNCPNGDANFNSADYQGSPFSYFLTPLNWIINNALSFAPGAPYPLGSPSWTNTWTFSVDISLVGASPNYSESGGVGTATFCMRYGLVDTEDQATFILVNFRQMLVSISWDLTVEDFEVIGVTTQAIEEVVGSETLDDVFDVVVNICSTPVGAHYHQGEEICIEVCESTGNAYGKSFDDLYMQIVNDPNNAFQQVIQGGSAVGGMVNDPTCSGPCCQVTLLLLGLFFPVDINNSPDNYATVTGEGDVTFSLISNRRLSEGRALQEEQQVPFETEFTITRPVSADSGSSLMGLAGAIGAMGAALLL